VVRFALDLLLWELLLGFMTNKIAAIARANNLTLVADCHSSGTTRSAESRAPHDVLLLFSIPVAKPAPGCSTLSMGSRLKGCAAWLPVIELTY